MLAPESLSPRHRVILRALIHMYVDTHQPVGSRPLTKRYDLKISPATVRNVMADLEERELITHPHPSAGRVPTDGGYRCYVDDLMPERTLPESDRRQIQETAHRGTGLLDDRLRNMVELLASLTPYTVMIQLPADAALRLRELHLLPLGDGRAVVVLTTAVGAVRHRVVDLPVTSPVPSLERMSGYLTRHLTGSRLGDAPALLAALPDAQDDEGRLREACLAVARQLLEPDTQGPVLLDGAVHLMEQPEFQDGRRARALMRLLDEKATLSAWLADDARRAGSGRLVCFQIGAENLPEDAHDCSLATAPFQVGTAQGHLALLGPTRMRYPRAAAILRFASARLTEQFAAYAA